MPPKPAPRTASRLPATGPLRRIALIGAGPTAVYTLSGLMQSPVALEIDIFESGRQIGPGMPYSEEMNDPAMLSNIGSRELPPVIGTLNEWLRELPVDQLGRLGLTEAMLDEDSFYPRLTLGAWFTAQMAELIARGRGRGHRIEVRLRHRVTDIAPRPDGIHVSWQSPDGSGTATYDDAVLATGHAWPDRTDAGVQMISPWPAEKIARMAQDRIGVLGSSLSAIDVAVAVASARGRFSKDQTRYEARPSRDFTLTLLSRKGLLPEADYWYDLPLPEMPRLAKLANLPGAKVAAAYDAFLEDLTEADPDYAAALGAPPLEGFAEAYFARRMDCDPFDWAERNLREAEEGVEQRRATPWRSAVLRAHEIFEEMLPGLPEAELKRFHATLRPVFVDCYACVPHDSIRRMLALHAAGHLNVVATGETPKLRQEGKEIALDDEGLRFDALVDARGQQAMSLKDLPFPSLAKATLPKPLRFEDYILPLAVPTTGRVHCLALPVLLRRHPFAQGLVNAAEMGAETARAILVTLAVPEAAE
ncbi:FAD/NAD(P)-binding protein [Sagittula salina]|uniref:FAD/NAD(P)-binding protein n=1 Tax=Sagittula salina TaxID=2820268 RepID=A0A940MK64_9RHOB|nr:FAD/NAD(P)-binding protein [Sagittula salina]MBP0483011.1 FAD/NAD(P)-binding protein [Sagittula salina]